MNTPPLMSERTSLTSETLIRTTNNVGLSSTTPSLSLITDNDGILNNSQNKILIRTERLLESNHNFEKILESLREQVRFLFSIDNMKQKGKNRTINYLKKARIECICVASFLTFL
jgi:endo-alpha-1,4-polygalactosaminidase (GH114 family)